MDVAQRSTGRSNRPVGVELRFRWFLVVVLVTVEKVVAGDERGAGASSHAFQMTRGGDLNFTARWLRRWLTSKELRGISVGVGLSRE